MIPSQSEDFSSSCGFSPQLGSYKAGMKHTVDLNLLSLLGVQEIHIDKDEEEKTAEEEEDVEDLGVFLFSTRGEGQHQPEYHEDVGV